jgi:hypothetical protein
MGWASHKGFLINNVGYVRGTTAGGGAWWASLQRHPTLDTSQTQASSGVLHTLF